MNHSEKKELRVKWTFQARQSMHTVFRHHGDLRMHCQMLVGEAKDCTDNHHAVAKSMGGWIVLLRDAMILCLPVIDGALFNLMLPRNVGHMFNPCLEAELPTGIERIELPLIQNILAEYYFLRIKNRHYAYYIRAFPKFTTTPTLFFNAEGS